MKYYYEEIMVILKVLLIILKVLHVTAKNLKKA